MLFLQFILYQLSFVGTLKYEISGAALKPCQLKIKQFSPDIPKFRTKHKDNPFTLNYSLVLRTFLFIFHAGSRRLGSNSFQNSSYKEKTAGSASVSRLSSISYDYALTISDTGNFSLENKFFFLQEGSSFPVVHFYLAIDFKTRQFSVNSRPPTNSFNDTHMEELVLY